MAKKRKNDEIESDTDPIGMKPKRKGKQKNEQEQPLASLILEGRSDDVRIVTVHAEPPKKKRLFKPYSELTLWEKVKGCVFWVFAVLVLLVVVVPKDKDDADKKPASNQVVVIPTNTVQPTITPVSRATLTAQALVALDVAKTQTTPTQTPIIEYVVITATPSETDIPTETSIPSDVPLPSATPMTSNVAVAMVTNTPIPSATATPSATPTNTAIPTQSGVRVMTDTGVVTGQSVRVRSCASTECQELGRLFNGVTFPITGSVSDGQSIEGNRLWYQITYNGQVGYVSATLAGLASAQPVSPPVGQNVSPIQPTQPISVAPQWNCSGDIYNCDSAEFTSCTVIWSYFNSCPGDPSRLDGNNDMIPCNSRCG